MSDVAVSHAETSPGAAYALVREELITALCSLDDAGAAMMTPSCPAWSTKDVVAHLCGLNAEKLAGVQGSLGADEATTRQVADRASLTLPQVIDEWQSLAEPVRGFMAAEPAMAAAFLADLVVHVFDLAEVHAQPTAAAAAATPLSAQRYVPLLQTRVADVVDVALEVELTDGATWPAPDGSQADQMSLRATSHGFLRGVTGRLTRAQVESLGWSGDPSRILDNAWNQYGPFRA